jgi:hypothetical protein
MSFYKTEAIKEIFPRESIKISNINTPKSNLNSSTNYNSEYKFDKLEQLIDLEKKIHLKNENTLCLSEAKDKFIELDSIFFEKYKEYLITVYKHFSNIFYDSNFSIFMNYNGYLKFMKEIGLVFLNTDKTNKTSNFISTTGKGKESGNYLNDKLKSNLFSLNTLNLLFSKFSNETLTPEKRDSNLNINVFKKNIGRSQSGLAKESNKKLNFKSFIKILLCISNKIFNNKFNTVIIESQKDFNLDKLLCSDSKHMQQYLEMFVCNYIKPCYNDIKTFIEKESYDLMLLENILNDTNIDLFFSKIKPSLYRIFLIYTDGRETIYLDEFSK